MKHSIFHYILVWVEENIESGKKIADLIYAIGYTRKTIETWFSNEYGLTPGEYLFKRRMSRASVLLRLTYLSISEIASLLHYSTSQNFSRAYRKFSGKTPQEYRNSERWDASILQFSLLYNVNVGSIEEVFFPEIHLKGSKHIVHETILYEQIKIKNNGIQKIVQGLFRNNIKETFVSVSTLATFDIKKNRAGIVDAEAYVGVLIPQKTAESFSFPGGTYCHCEFRGTWYDYYVCSFNFFIKLMSSEKYSYRGGNHYIHFYNAEERVSDFIKCDIYIPVSYA
ncbi:helix-turn-helix domain-containing protein [Escherichia coli]|nr:helix-turn-helix domain-containing protein [Escherichia coli]MDF0838554.1 helix-turn-helix domain-containing protein [Escherichia coli]